MTRRADDLIGVADDLARLALASIGARAAATGTVDDDELDRLARRVLRPRRASVR